MKLDDILQQAGRHKGRKRLGRGDGSGHGKTSGRGHKGYGQRSGAKKRLGYEGGQSTVISRIPKRGFNNKNFRTVFQVVNIADLQEVFDDGATVTAESLQDAGLIDITAGAVKILGDGELSKTLTVQASKFSRSAIEKITAAGGQAQTPDGQAVQNASGEAAPKQEANAEKPDTEKPADTESADSDQND
jgi:large subunit ribosomal protein L15